jgi:hypothetical protein
MTNITITDILEIEPAMISVCARVSGSLPLFRRGRSVRFTTPTGRDVTAPILQHIELDIEADGERTLGLLFDRTFEKCDAPAGTTLSIA